MIPKSLESVTKADIDLLITTSVAEGREIEYKSALPATTDEGRREFLADICAFANTSGGDLIFGLHANQGIPAEAKGVSMSNVDQQILTFDNVIREGIAPRINGVRIRAVDGFPAGPVLIIRIPRSWSSPHMVKFRDSSRFYIRNNAGKHQMDVGEIRSAFSLSETLPERIRQFRDERIGKIYCGDPPVTLDSGGAIVMHLLPLVSFSGSFQIDLSKTTSTMLRPLRSMGWDQRYNLDGLLSLSHSRDDHSSHYAYTLLFRSGRIESVYAAFVCPQGDQRFISSTIEASYLLDGLPTYLQTLKSLNVPTPLILLVSILGAKGAYLFVDNGHSLRRQAPIDRDILLLPDVMLEDYETDLTRLVRPISDALWNAGGFARSLNYDEDGRYKPQQ